MKKIILALVLFFNIMPRINEKGEFSLLELNTINAQPSGYEGDGDPGGPGLWNDGQNWEDHSILTSGQTGGGSTTGTGDAQYWDDHEDDDNSDDDWGYPGDWDDYWDFYDIESDMMMGPSNPFNPFVHLELNSDNSKKYYTGATFPFLVQAGKYANFKVVDEHGVLVADDYTWEINTVKRCESVDKCRVPISVSGDYILKIYNNKTNEKLLQVYVIVYNKASVIFQKKALYKGEYGFDDVGWQYDSLKNYYQTKYIDSTPYHVPWMSLVDGQEDTVRVNSIMSPANISDPNYFVTFKPDTNAIKINGLDTLRVSAAALASTYKTIRISATTLDTAISHYVQRGINVINNYGDTIGKLNVSCKSPSVKKVMFVYVNKGTGYRFNDYNKDSIIAHLNQKSHNQIFKEWKVKDGLSDTLDLTYEYTTNPSFFTSNTFYNSYVGSLFGFYNSHKSNAATNANYSPSGSVYPLTDSNRVYFFFITDIPKNPLDSTLSGISLVTLTSANSTIFESGIIGSKYSTTLHELGHCLYLDHTFDNGLPIQRFCPSIPIFTTDNFMDYWYKNVPERRNRFYLYQWLKSN